MYLHVDIPNDAFLIGSYCIFYRRYGHLQFKPSVASIQLGHLQQGIEELGINEMQHLYIVNYGYNKNNNKIKNKYSNEGEEVEELYIYIYIYI